MYIQYCIYNPIIHLVSKMKEGAGDELALLNKLIDIHRILLLISLFLVYCKFSAKLGKIPHKYLQINLVSPNF